jgi:hypothetical protein
MDFTCDGSFMFTSPELIGGLRDILNDFALSSIGEDDRSLDFVRCSSCRSMLLALLLANRFSLTF